MTSTETMTRPKKLTVRVKDEEIDDLKARLRQTRWPDQLEGVGWEYGSELSYMKELVEYWEKSFDWRSAEEALNTFSNYELDVNGINLHFIHERSSAPDAIPLIISHGWPGSVFEFHKIIHRLTATGKNGSKKQAFHVVAPSLPGYGFSSAPKEPGFGPSEIAKTFDELMVALGYTSYVAQGGDWGSLITTLLGAKHSEHCKAVHINFCFAPPNLFNPWHVAQLANASLPIANWFPLFISYQEMQYLRNVKEFQEKETGYSSIQATKPQTLGYALNDSPAGLAAWIVEKFRTWSDCGGDVESRFTKDELLTHVSLYWFNQNITSSARLYYEAMGPFAKDKVRESLSGKIKVPTAVAIFPKELYQAPRAWAASKYNLKQWSVFKSGGHFAAMEEPDALADDMQKFFATYH